MTIKKLFNHPHVLHQKTDDEYSRMPEPDVSACIDATGLIILGQSGQEILINPESVPELCKLLRMMRGFSEQME